MDLSSAGFNNVNKINNIGFLGKKTVKDSEGDEFARFYVPPQIKLGKDEKLGIEFIPFEKKGTSYQPSKTIEPIRYDDEGTVEFDEFENGKKNYIDIEISGLKRNGEYGYRFVIYDKNGNPKNYITDSVGTTVNSEKNGAFTVASTRQGSPATGGLMYHAFIDSYNAPKMKDFKRNHFNSAGGNISSLTDKINNSNELEQYDYIMTTPIVGGDKSRHGYHPENLFHTTRGMGSIEDFKNLQLACFNHGKKYVVDGAFTSQGYQGVQLNHAIKWMDSPFKYWFKNPGNNGYSLGVLSDKPEINNKYTGIRIVNHSTDENYNPDMPTYIQFYDTRLASNKQLSNTTKLIETYENADAADPYEITTWHDGTIQNWFEISPNIKLPNGKLYASVKEWDDSNLLEKVLNPLKENYSFVRRGQVAGTTGWDGNIDLVKSNESNHVNIKEYKKGRNQVRNQIFNVGTYWTEVTRDSLIQEVANNLNKLNSGKTINTDNSHRYSNTGDYLASIERNFNLEEGRLKKVGDTIDNYNLNIAKDKRDANAIIQDKILKFPLDSLEYSNELLAVLSTPYITPRPSANGNPAAGKLETLKDAEQNTEFSKQMDEVYTEILPTAFRHLLNDIQTQKGAEKLFNSNSNDIGNLTEYGKYFVQMAMPEFMQFMITEALFGDKMKLPYTEEGQIDFNTLRKNAENNGNELSLKKLGITESTSQKEAEAVAKKIKKGLSNIDEAKLIKFRNYLTNKYGSVSLNDYKMAEAIIDQTGAGLNWRFDAAKDVADWDEVKSGKIKSDQAWDDVISFWKPFVKNVRTVNPSSFIVAEVTSLHDFNSYDWGRYENADKAESIFYEETGATTGSNYSTFFGAYPKLFGKNVEDGNYENYASIRDFLGAAKGFCLPGEGKGHQSSEFILGSHVFTDNHDKPREAHLMGVEADLFWSNFNGIDDEKRNELATKYLGRPYNDNMSSKAVAVSKQYHEYFEKEGKELGADAINALQKAIKHLANGYQYKTNNTVPDFTKAEAFATMPYEITIPHVIEQAKTFGLKADNTKLKELEDKVFEDMVAPYESKMASQYELMVGTVGIPTLFAGAEFAQTGCETKSKNWSLGCRNTIRHDWVTSKDHVAKFNRRIKAAGLLSKQEGMSPLADGTPVILPSDPLQNVTKETVIQCATNLKNSNQSDNLSSACGFLKSCADKETAENSSLENIVEEINSMDEKELITKFQKQVGQYKTKNEGLYDWLVNNKNLGRVLEAGAIYKYNDKGEGVITVVTNAFMPKTEGVSKLLTPEEAKAPVVSKIKLVDSNDNLIAEPGTEFERMTYHKGKYTSAGKYEYKNDGTLQYKGEGDPPLDSTVTFFRKVKK